MKKADVDFYIKLLNMRFDDSEYDDELTGLFTSKYKKIRLSEEEVEGIIKCLKGRK